LLSRTAVERDEKCSLLLVDFAAAPLELVAQQLRDEGARVVSITADISDVTVPAEIADCARNAFGGIDGIVSNAGALMKAPMELMSLEDFERMFAVNTRATWLLAKALYPQLKASRGSLVATASISATQPTPPHGAYSASKAALVMLIKQMAYEWGPDGIRCNCVSPGMIHTGMTDQVYGDAALRAERASNIPLRRVGEPEDVARVVSFLMGTDASYITGVDLAVDGGVHTALMPTIRRGAVPG